MSEELVRYDAGDEMRLGVLRVQSPEAVIQRASEIASALADLIRKRGLALRIRSAEYVKVDGWAVMGAMLGIVPREKETRRLEDGSYESVVELIRTTDGAVVGGASAICGMDEKRWAEMPEYARRSMALTRAVGKAFRLGFSWIIALAGYEPTPAEEIVDAEPVQSQPKSPASPAKDPTTAFWSWAKEHGVPDRAAQQFIQDAGKDFVKALRMMQATYSDTNATAGAS